MRCFWKSFKQGTISVFIKNKWNLILKSGVDSRELGGDVDTDGRLWAHATRVLAVAIVLRICYIEISGVPVAEKVALPAFILAIAFFIISFPASRLGFREATLAFRGISFFMAAFPFAQDMCVDVFHTGRRFPLIDDNLAALDRMLGFDWISYARIFDESPFFWTASKLAYVSIDMQFIVVIVVIAYARSATRLYAYLIAQLTALTIVALIAAFLPCLGAYTHLNASHAGFLHHDFITGDRMVSSIAWLRQDILGSGGVTNFMLISFPSYHACCAILFAWGTWPSPLRWPSIVINILMLAATPVHGSHYLIDLIGGIAIGLAAAGCATFWLGWITQPVSVSGGERKRSSRGSNQTSPEGEPSPGLG